MVIKNGKFGKFAACPNFPKCKNTKSISETKPEETVEKEKEKESDDTVPGMKCEKCGADMVVKNGRYGAFYACSNYPKCKFTKPKNKEIDIPCPK
jgi:DNA topoisomerase-1